jgi:hypothetical protein
MDQAHIERMRREQRLRRLPDGSEALEMTLQYPGTIPADTRAHRKAWLEEHFHKLDAQLGQLGVERVPDGISTSGQSVRILVPVHQLAALDSQAAKEGYRLDIVSKDQVVG